jgi:hypothetical protein
VKSTPVVKSITLNLTATEAADVQTFITAYYRKYPYMGGADSNPIFKAIKAGLKGEAADPTVAAFDRVFGVSARF